MKCIEIKKLNICNRVGSGKLFGWGSNDNGQIHEHGDEICMRPTLISNDEIVRTVSCGKTCTAFISGRISEGMESMKIIIRK